MGLLSGNDGRKKAPGIWRCAGRNRSGTDHGDDIALGPVAIAASAQRQHVQCGHPHLRHAHHGDHDLFFVRLAQMQVGASTQRLPADGLSFDGGSISSNKANKANKVGVLLFRNKNSVKHADGGHSVLRRSAGDGTIVLQTNAPDTLRRPGRCDLVRSGQ